MDKKGIQFSFLNGLAVPFLSSLIYFHFIIKVHEKGKSK